MNEPLIQDDRLKAEFAARYKKYRCEHKDVPSFEQSSGPGSKFRSTQFGDHLILKLQLGKRIHLKKPNSGGPMRTESRYELYWDEKLVCSAESLFSNDDVLSAEGLSTVFAYHPTSQSILVFEELEWTTKRYIVFESTGQSDALQRWSAKYFELPARERYRNPTVEWGQFRGFGNRKIYLEIDGLLYAFPFDDFLVKTLDFTVG